MIAYRFFTTNYSLLITQYSLLIIHFCPGKEAALSSIVVSLTCTIYQCGTLIVFCDIHCYILFLAKYKNIS